MPIDVLMPQLSPTMTEGRLAKWVKKIGDKISAGDVLAEVETDKATMEVEASDDGILHLIVGEIGADLPVGAPIAVLRGKDESVAEGYMPKGRLASSAVSAPASQAAVSIAAPVQPVAQPVVVVPAVPVVVQPAVVSVGRRVKASPLAKRLAAQKGVDLAGIAGSGPAGRIVAADIENAQASGGARRVVRKPDAVVKLTPMRKAIAARLTAAKQSVPHFYLKRSADLSRLMAMRAELNEYLGTRNQEPGGQGVKISVNDLIIKASALALRDYPAANAAWNPGSVSGASGDSVVQWGNVDIAVAVAIEGGLITPIVANADQKAVTAISSEMKQLAADARAGKLKPAQYEGGSFSISNLGMYGIEEFSAIINPPQAAILAVGAADKANILRLTLSVDHRVIDGALGAELLAAICGYLEKPSVLIVGS
ncbi:MAG: pyruvate dehydrogenase complex dihydrolipoamide acetyltransferase [Proteobacteria bacterium]|nr:pyruvate dehydrogenase complex dihydrolipoamide acetyltransferase [Pseudomonadota bacterium]